MCAAYPGAIRHTSSRSSSVRHPAPTSGPAPELIAQMRARPISGPADERRSPTAGPATQPGITGNGYRPGWTRYPARAVLARVACLGALAGATVENVTLNALPSPTSAEGVAMPTLAPDPL
jgi:hypothetical protein